MSTEESSRPVQIETVPAPWNVKVEAWWFITSLGARSPELGETLPINYFPSQERQLYQTSMEQGAFKRGRGSVILLRYIDTPIGAFDELAVSPGEFTNPFERPAHRITRSYVSSISAVVNGRTNWGLPRELAQFVYTPSLDHSDATEVRVYPATSFSPVEFAPEACFAALIKPLSWLPSIPASLAFPDVKLYQPPLEVSEDPAYDGLVGTTKWHVLECTEVHGRAKPFRSAGLLKPRDEGVSANPDAAKHDDDERVYADGVSFPEVDPYSTGIHWTEVRLTLPQAVPLATL